MPCIGMDQKDNNNNDEVQIKRGKVSVEADEWLSNDSRWIPSSTNIE